MKIKTNKFCVSKRKKIILKDWPTIDSSLIITSEQYHEMLKDHIAQLSKLQNLLYATDRYSLLLILQGMDAAGKDGAIKHVMSGINPQGCNVSSFKKPSEVELQHDFLWRTTQHLPARGQIGIFNRSYYEETLILRVHPEMLNNEGLKSKGTDDDFWAKRYDSIVDFEKHLHRNNTRIVKIYLHLSKEEQKKRFLARIDLPEKNWKLSLADIQERQFFKQYTHAYEDCLSKTSTDHAPWHIVPADDKYKARLIISQIILDTLSGLQMTLPVPSVARRSELKKIRKFLEK